MPVRRTSLRWKAVLAAAVALVVSAVTTTAYATSKETLVHDADAPIGLTPAVLAEMQAQEKLQPAVSALYEEHMRSPGSGFAGLAFEDDGLTLYHNGALSPGLAGALTTARKAGPVRVKPAAHSQAELETQMARVEQYLRSRGAVSDIQSVGRKTDGSGLIVERAPEHARAEMVRRRSAAGKSAPLDAAEVLRAAGVTAPTEVVVAKSTVSFGSSRVADTSPWNGGGRFETWHDTNRDGIQDRFAGRCTTGFGVNAAGRSWILTAAHCATRAVGDITFQGVFNGGTGTTFTRMGLVHRDYYEYDLLLINTNGWNLIFDGGPWTSVTKPVRSWGYHVENELLCRSGATSGTVCGLRTGGSHNVTMTCCDSDGDSGYTVFGLIKAVQVNGMIAARPGDSGGPVFSLDGSGVRAKGTYSLGTDQTYMYFQDWADVIRLFSAYPRTA